MTSDLVLLMIQSIAVEKLRDQINSNYGAAAIRTALRAIQRLRG